MRNLGVALIVLTGVATALGGCTDRELKPLNPCVISNFVDDPQPEGVSAVDLLFVVDSSASMIEEQAALAEEFPQLVQLLASGNSDPADDIPNFDPVDLHVGVITTDLGIGIESLVGLGSCSLEGDDAVMVSTPGDAAAGTAACSGVSITPNFLTFDPENPDPDFSNTFGCLAQVGATGCFTEQQLEATLKALTPTDAPIAFASGSQTGQGNPDGPNANFLREDSLLAVIMVSDEDDCSWFDARLFDDPASQYFGGLNARCSLPRNAGALRPIGRYVDGLLGGTVDGETVEPLVPPERLVFAVIGGIPPDQFGTTEFDAMLQSPELSTIQVVEPSSHPAGGLDFLNPVPGGEPVAASTLPDTDPDGETAGDFDDIDDYSEVFPSCIRAIPDQAPAVASPPVRLVETAKQLSLEGAAALVTSICKEDATTTDPTDVDFSDALNDILTAIADRISGACLPRPLNPLPSGEVQCEIIEVQPAGTTSCNEARGRLPLEPPADMTEDGRVVCSVQQLLPQDTDMDGAPDAPPASGEGWFYDDFSAEVQAECSGEDKQRITFTSGAEPVIGTEVRLECLQATQGSAGEVVNGSPCTEEADCDGSPQFGDALSCNPVTLTCLLPCEQGGQFLTSTCEEAGLRGFVCDSRDDQNTKARGFCVDPTCQP